MSTLPDTKASVYGGAIDVVEVSAITLTICNGFAAALVLILTIVDNFQHQKSWCKMGYERRTPFYLAITILLSTVAFAAREFIEMGSGIPFTSTDSSVPSIACIALHQISWSGNSFEGFN